MAFFLDCPLFVLGTAIFVLTVIIPFWGVYAEGKATFINLGNKLIRKDLNPSEFLKIINGQREDNSLVICKPSVEILIMTATAYDLLDDKENCLLAVDEMVSIAGEKKVGLSCL